VIPGQPFRSRLPELIGIATALLALACGGTTVTELAGPDDVRCQVTLSSDTRTIAAEGGTVNVTVTAARECEWTASTDAGWAKLSTTSGQGAGSIAVAIAATHQATPRTAAVTVNTQRLDVSQEGRPCSYQLSSSRADIGVAAGRLTVTVSTLDGCAWQATSGESWLSVPAPAKTGSGTVIIEVAENATGSPREGVVTIAGQPFTVLQRATSGPAPPGPPVPGPQTCTPVVQPATLEVTHQAAAHTVRLDVGGGCEWRASSSAPWIAVAAPASGTGAAQVRLTVAENTAAARTGTVTIAEQTVTVRQAAAPCAYSIDPAQLSFSHNGGEGRIQLTTRADCEWTAASDAFWADVLTERGRGPTEVRYAVQLHTGGTDRTATVTVADKTHRVTQRAFVSTCTYSIDPGEQTVAAPGGESRFRIITQNGCEWHAEAGAGWITVVTTTGTGTQEIVFRAERNGAPAPRSTTISVAGHTHRVTQTGVAAACAFSLNPPSQAIPADGGGGRFTVTAPSGCAWNLGGGAQWISIQASASSGPGEVTYTVPRNPNPQPRSATIVVGGQNHAVTQAATAPSCTFTLNPSSASLPASGGEGRFTVVTQAGCTWSASTPAGGWVSITSNPSGTGQADVVYTVRANTGTQPRSAAISVGSQSHAITQAGAAPSCTFTLNPSAASLPAAPGEGRFTVSTQAGCTWSAAAPAVGWLSITSGASGTGPGDVVYSVQANTSTQPRSTAITAGGRAHSVTQAGAAAPPPPSP
jgi:hypothetical protein